MRMLDAEDDRVLREVSVYLTQDEATRLLGLLTALIENPETHHIHVNDAEYEHEITLAVYSDENLTQFDERSQRLILKDQ